MIAMTDAVTLRLLERGEDERMARLFFRLSPETVYRRFLTHYSDPHALRPLLDVDGHTRVAVVAADPEGEIIGVARYTRLIADPDSAEISVVVQDESQGRGIGLLLLTALAHHARAAGVHSFTGTMLSTNDACAALMRRALPGVRFARSNGETTLHADL